MIPDMAPVLAPDGFPDCARCQNGRVVLQDVYKDGVFLETRVVPCPDCGVIEVRRAQATSALSTRAEDLSTKTFANFRTQGARDGMPISSLRLGLEAAQKFAETPEGWLVLYGPPGTGKTHLLGAIYNALLARAKPAVYVSAISLLSRIKQTFGSNEEREEDVFARYLNAPVLLIDDLGQEQATEWAETIWFSLFNARYINRAPTVISTNLDITSAAQIGAALSDRMMDTQLVTRVLLNAASYRREYRAGQHETR